MCKGVHSLSIDILDCIPDQMYPSEIGDLSSLFGLTSHLHLRIAMCYSGYSKKQIGETHCLISFRPVCEALSLPGSLV